MTPEQLKDTTYLPEDLNYGPYRVMEDHVALNSLTTLRRLETAETLVKQLAEKGLISDIDREIASLKSTLNHANRIIDVRKREGKPYSEITEALEVIQDELDSLQASQ